MANAESRSPTVSADIRRHYRRWVPFSGPHWKAAAALKNKVKITDVKCMIVRGTWDWNLIKIETDSGLYGIGEAYWGWGVKDLVLNKLKPIVVGEDPLNVDKLYTKMLMQSAGRGRHRRRHHDGGQRHRDRAVGSLRAHPANARLQSAGRPFPRPRPLLPDAAERSQQRRRSWQRGARRCRRAQAEKWGWTAFKFQGDGVPPQSRPRISRAGPRPLRPQPDAQGLPPHREGHGDGARDAGARRRFRDRVPLAVRHSGRDPPGRELEHVQADVAGGSGAARQYRGDGAGDAGHQRPGLHRRESVRRGRASAG